MSNFYSQDPPPNWRGPGGAPQQQYGGYGSPRQQSPYPPQQQYGGPANYQEEQSYGAPYAQQQNYAVYQQPQSYGQEQYGDEYRDQYMGPGDRQMRGQNGERGIGASLVGAGAGAFLGHEMKGGPVADIGGAIIGAIAANAFEKHEKKKHAKRDAEKVFGSGYADASSRDIGDNYDDEYVREDEYAAGDVYERPHHHHHHHRDYDDGNQSYDYQRNAYSQQDDRYNRRY